MNTAADCSPRPSPVTWEVTRPSSGEWAGKVVVNLMGHNGQWFAFLEPAGPGSALELAAALATCAHEQPSELLLPGT